VVSDDWYSSAINIGFSFTFYGTTYTQLVVGTNGCLNFTTSNANNYNSWPGNAMPNPNPSNMRNTINFPWEDLYNPMGGTTYYGTIGTAPNRIFILEMCNIPYYSCWTNILFSGQVLLYEGTNVIEQHLGNKPICSQWNGGGALQGVQNSTGTTASIVTGRNWTQWSASSEGKRWTWNNSSGNYDITSISFAPVPFLNAGTITWYDASNSPVGTGTTYTTSSALTAGIYVYHAQMSLSNCW